MKKIREFTSLARRFRQTPIVDDDFQGMRNEFDSDLWDLSRRLQSLPAVVTLCGSTRFQKAFEAAAREFTMSGLIVLSVGMFGHVDGLDMNGQVKKDLDNLHKQKISISDSVFVLNVGGYIGSSTRSEIEYAEAIGIPVKYLEPIEGE